MIFEESNEEDIFEIVKCHKSAFLESFQVKLGDVYLHKMLKWYLINTKAKLFHLKLDSYSPVCGYLAIVLNDVGIAGSSTGMFHFTKKELFKGFLRNPLLLFYPENLKRVKFLFRKIGISLNVITPRTNKPSDFSPSVGLVIIGVSIDFWGKGIGTKLLHQLEKFSKDSGFRRMTLSVKAENTRAISFYQLNGWTIFKVNNDSFEMEKYID